MRLEISEADGIGKFEHNLRRIVRPGGIDADNLVGVAQGGKGTVALPVLREAERPVVEGPVVRQLSAEAQDRNAVQQRVSQEGLAAEAVEFRPQEGDVGRIGQRRFEGGEVFESRTGDMAIRKGCFGGEDRQPQGFDLGRGHNGIGHGRRGEGQEKRGGCEQTGRSHVRWP